MDFSKLLKIISIVIIVIVIIGYAFYQTQNLAKGPILDIISPADNSTFTEPLVVIRGFVKNTSYITLNGRQIYADESGVILEKLLLLEGYNVVEVEVKDKFEREKKEVLELVYKPENEAVEVVKQENIIDEKIATTSPEF